MEYIKFTGLYRLETFGPKSGITHNRVQKKMAKHQRFISRCNFFRLCKSSSYIHIEYFIKKFRNAGLLPMKISGDLFLQHYEYRDKITNADYRNQKIMGTKFSNNWIQAFLDRFS